MLALERDGKRGDLSGLVWCRGNTKRDQRKMAEDYEALLSDFIRSFGKSAGSVPTRSHWSGEQPHLGVWRHRRKCQVEVCRKDQRTVWSKPGPATRERRWAHFTADGMLTLGSRFAKCCSPLRSHERYINGNRLPPAGRLNCFPSQVFQSSYLG